MQQFIQPRRFWLWLGLCLFVLSLLFANKEPGLRRWGNMLAPPANAEPEADELEREGAERFNWFYAQRAYPQPDLPPAARAQALEQLRLAEVQLQRGLYRVAEQAQQLAWQSLGPAPIGEGPTFGVPRAAVSGRVSTLAFDPGYNGTSNQTVYLGAAMGGVWRSRDNGATWTPLTDEQPSLAMGAVALDPSNPNIIYAGTGDAIAAAIVITARGCSSLRMAARRGHRLPGRFRRPGRNNRRFSRLRLSNWRSTRQRRRRCMRPPISA